MDVCRSYIFGSKRLAKEKQLLKEIKVSQQQQEEDTFALFWTQLEEHLSFSENVGNLLTVGTDQLPCIYISMFLNFFVPFETDLVVTSVEADLVVASPDPIFDP